MLSKKLLYPLILLAMSISGCGLTRRDASSPDSSVPGESSSEGGGGTSETSTGQVTSDSQSSESQGSSETSSESTSDSSSGGTSESSSETSSESGTTSESPIPTEHMTLVGGEISHSPTDALLNPDVPITYYMPIGGYYTGVTNPPNYVIGRVRVVFTSSSALLTQLTKWNVTVEGGGQASTPVTGGVVGVSGEVYRNDVTSNVTQTPTKDNSRYVQVIVSVQVETIEQFVIINEATYSIDIYYE